MTYHLIQTIGIAYAIFFGTAIAYVAVMHFKIIKDNPAKWDALHWSTKALGYQMLYLGLVFDMLLNVLVMTVILLELPKEILTTQRIQRWYSQPNGGYRHRVALFFGRNYLNPFDAGHIK